MINNVDFTKKYKQLKRERNDAIGMNKALYNDIINLQIKYDKLKKASLKLFEV